MSPQQIKDVRLTDAHQANVLEDWFGRDILFDLDLAEWHRYSPNTGMWPVDLNTASILDTIQERADEGRGPAENNSVLRALVALLDNQPQQRALDALSVRPAYHVRSDAWDRDAHLLGCANGVLDLRTGTLLDANEARDKRVTLSSGIEYVPDLVPEGFLAHMALVQPDPVMRAYLMRCFGYMLTGETGEQLWWFWYGPKAANGKSQTADIIRLTLGEYGTIVQPALFVRNQFSNPINIGSSVHAMRHARMGDLAELSHVGELDSELIKRIVEGAAGGITYRKPYGSGDLTAHPPTKLLGHGNSRPVVTDSGNGFWRRVKVVGWDEVVPEDRRINDFGSLLVAEEGPAILSLLAREAQAYYEQGLAPEPASIAATTAEYRASSDPFATWVNDAILVTGKDEDAVKAGSLFEEYQRWCDDQNIKPSQRVDGQRFPTRLLEATGNAADRVKRREGMVYLRIKVFTPEAAQAA